ncbi:MAG: FtsH protease activity modulator HflK [Candidatus Omnitrophica bacterium]|nr:FtsH protease activity modulator HflK [Candidatus Omnitrophota bacterium]
MDFERVIPDEIIHRGKRLYKYLPFKSFFSIIIILLIIICLPTIFYTVEPSEVGVVRRFGKFVRITKPGLHFKLPFKIEKVNKVKVEYIFKEEFGFRSAQPGIRSVYSQKSYDDESLMLTGDLNVLDVEWIVQFKIKDPVKFLFNIRDQRKTLRDVSESVIREIVGDYSFNEVLTGKRLEINNLAQEKMQNILDFYGSGIQIVTVKLQDVNPPSPVQPAFNEVNQAKQEREKMINEAWQIYNQKIPRAEGEALKIVREAEGYAQEVVNRALGDAERFNLIYSAYRSAKEVTLKRLYLEKLKEIVSKAGRVYVLDPQEKGILPLLKLREDGK